MLLEDRVVFITGAARGQGRSHALRAAAEGADIVLVDIGKGSIEHPAYPTASSEELSEAAELVRKLGRRSLSYEADVRDYDVLCSAAERAVEEFGRIDCVVANAGIADGFYPTWEIPIAHWQTMLDVNLTGVFNTCKATIPHLLKSGKGKSMVLVSSAAAIRAFSHFGHYNAAKAGVRSLSLTLAQELGPYGIRVNSLYPGAIDSPMISATADLAGISREDFLKQFHEAQLLDAIGQPEDTSSAVVWLLSDEAKHITGLEMIVDAGETKK